MVWVEARAFLFHHDDEAAGAVVRPGGDFDEIAWQPFTAKSVNNIPSNHARLVREAIAQLKESGRMEASTADTLLARTG